MKYAFLLACVAAGVAFSVLSAILVTGRIPFRPPPAPPADTTKAQAQPVAAAGDPQKVIGELVEAIRKERSEYNKKLTDLANREQELRQQQQIFALLKEEILKLQRKTDESVVQIAQSEQANFKRLADMYGKMQPDSASALLRETEPERAASILSLLDQRQAAGVLEAAVASGDAGAKTAAKWSDIIRRMAKDKGEIK